VGELTYKKPLEGGVAQDRTCAGPRARLTRDVRP
jgi:hypothetical protein